MTLNRSRPRSQNFRIRYLEYHKRYTVRHNGGQIGNHEWAFDWRHDLWHCMTLNSPSSRSSKLHAKYLKNDDRYRQHWTDSEFAWTLYCSNMLSVSGVLGLCCWCCGCNVAHPFNASCSKLLMFKGFGAILVQPTIFNFVTFGRSGAQSWAP